MVSRWVSILITSVGLFASAVALGNDEFEKRWSKEGWRFEYYPDGFAQLGENESGEVVSRQLEKSAGLSTLDLRILTLNSTPISLSFTLMLACEPDSQTYSAFALLSRRTLTIEEGQERSANKATIRLAWPNTSIEVVEDYASRFWVGGVVRLADYEDIKARLIHSDYFHAGLTAPREDGESLQQIFTFDTSGAQEAIRYFELHCTMGFDD